MKKNIPLSLIIWSISNRKVYYLQTYYYLKCRFGNDFVLKKDFSKQKKFIARELDTKPRTLNNRLKVLESLGWIWYNSDKVHIVGQKRIIQKLKDELEPNKKTLNVNLELVKDFKSIILGGIIKYIFNTSYVKSAIKKNGVAYKGLIHKGYFELSNSYLATFLNIEIGTASKLKNQLIKLGFIKRIKHEIELTQKQFQREKYLRSNYPEWSNPRIRLSKDKGVELRADFIKLVDSETYYLKKSKQLKYA